MSNRTLNNGIPSLLSILIMLIGCDAILKTNPATSIQAPWEAGHTWESPYVASQSSWASALESQSLLSVHTVMDSSNMTEWHAAYRTKQQSLAGYIESDPIRPEEDRQYIYVGALGSMTSVQWEVMDMTCEYLSLFWGLDVKYFGEISVLDIPEHARRINGKYLQFQTRFIMTEIMKPNLPDDAVNFIILTSVDLWPGNGWNYVFGQAAPNQRVGVWSMARYGNPEEGQAAYQLFIRRTLKTASHELGHMFSLQHCVDYECVMQGSMHLEEADQKPVYLCPNCLEKGAYACNYDVVNRFVELRDFWRTNDFMAEARAYDSFIDQLALTP